MKRWGRRITQEGRGKSPFYSDRKDTRSIPGKGGKKTGPCKEKTHQGGDRKIDSFCTDKGGNETHKR